jgi:hypothetical protein
MGRAVIALYRTQAPSARAFLDGNRFRGPAELAQAVLAMGASR